MCTLVRKKFNSARHVDAHNEKMLMNILTGAVSLGEVFCLLLGDVLINRLGWSWGTFVLIFAVILFSSTLSFYLGLEELPLETVEEGSFC